MSLRDKWLQHSSFLLVISDSVFAPALLCSQRVAAAGCVLLPHNLCIDSQRHNIGLLVIIPIIHGLEHLLRFSRNTKLEQDRHTVTKHQGLLRKCGLYVLMCCVVLVLQRCLLSCWLYGKLTCVSYLEGL